MSYTNKFVGINFFEDGAAPDTYIMRDLTDSKTGDSVIVHAGDVCKPALVVFVCTDEPMCYETNALVISKIDNTAEERYQKYLRDKEMVSDMIADIVHRAFTISDDPMTLLRALACHIDTDKEEGRKLFEYYQECTKVIDRIKEYEDNESRRQ